MFASPSLSPDGSTIYAPGSGGVIAINSTTYTKSWTFDAGVRGGTNYVGTPVYKNGNLYFATTGNLYCIDADTKAVKWQIKNPSIRPSTPVVIDTQVIAAGYDKQTINGVSHDVGIAGYNLADGTEIWHFSEEGRLNRASLVLAGNTVYFGTYNDGTLYAVNANDGHLVWKYVLPPVPGRLDDWYSH